MAITLYDIAKKANTSYGTVSRALSDHPRISLKTKKKVLKIASQLRYRPSNAGKVLRKGKTHTVGMIVPEFRNPYYIEFLTEVEKQCIDRKYRMVAIDFGKDASRERLCLEEMLQRRCDGIVTFMSRFEPLKDLIEEFWFSKMPCVVIGLPTDIGGIRIDGVTVDMGPGIEQAVDHLMELGHREIVLAASWPREGGTGGERVEGLQKAFKRHGLEYSQDSVFYRYSGDQLQDGLVTAKELLRAKPETTAIIGTNDLQATGIMRGLSTIGLSVPGDISLVGTDNTWIGQNWPVSLTSIDQNTRIQTQMATTMLFDRLKSQEWDEPTHVNMDTKLVIRESTGPVRKQANVT